MKRILYPFFITSRTSSFAHISSQNCKQRFSLPFTQASLSLYSYSDRFLSKSKFEVASYSSLNKKGSTVSK